MLDPSLRQKKKESTAPTPGACAFVTHMQLSILYNALPGRERIEGRFSRDRAHIKL